MLVSGRKEIFILFTVWHCGYRYQLGRAGKNVFHGVLSSKLLGCFFSKKIKKKKILFDCFAFGLILLCCYIVQCCLKSLLNYFRSYHYCLSSIYPINKNLYMVISQ